MRTAFDPIPHVKTLEKTLALLLPLRKQNAIKTSELERSVQQSERAYRGDVRGAKAGFETVNSQFITLDTKITSVGRTAVRIGEQLESIDKLRKRASEAHDLILYYNEFAKGDTSRLEQMRKEGGREGRQKVAVASRRLLSLSKEVDIGEGERGGEGAEKVREGIERYCERFEKDMLKLFDKYYRRGDPKAMAVRDFSLSQSSYSFHADCGRNVGLTALRSNFTRFQWRSILHSNLCQSTRFLHFERSSDRNRFRSRFFRDVRSLPCLIPPLWLTHSPNFSWDSLPDPNSPSPKSEPGLRSLYDEIRVTVGQEAQIVTAVFPNPSLVMQVFLQRVFAQVVRSFPFPPSPV